MVTSESPQQVAGLESLAISKSSSPSAAFTGPPIQDASSPPLAVALCEPASNPNQDRDARPFTETSPLSGERMRSLLPLSLRTDWPAASLATPGTEVDALLRHSRSATSLLSRTPSLRAAQALSSADSMSPPSVLSSPQLAAMGDITPLPSPIGYWSLSPWSSGRAISRPLSRASSTASRSVSYLNLRASDSTQALTPSWSLGSRSRPNTGPRRGDERATAKGGNDNKETTHQHTRNRSLSEYVPTAIVVPHVRQIAVSGPPQGGPWATDLTTQPNRLHREQYLAVHRGLALPSARPPTPPRSMRDGGDDSDSDPLISCIPSIDIPAEIYSVRSVRTKQSRKYRKLRQLGHGTFSQVCLAARIGDRDLDGLVTAGEHEPGSHCDIVPQKLVAVKIIEYGPAGGADEERVEVSLQREVDILKSVNHPSLVQLKAFGCDEKRALLILDYCPGGDLFEFATSGLKPLGPRLITRIFAELVAAVRYLHENFIVHRDIKLENVLVNPPAAAMQDIRDWRMYDRAVITLSDLGLSRRIPEPPESPLLHTRCGSEDYAAPEILMGQPYDGRSTDAWALGVLLYAMMENRLPFDALPGARGDPAKLRARTPHRIARCEWAWYRYADADGEWDPVKGRNLDGARECVEGLLKRNTKRKRLDEIAKMRYVWDAIDVPGGLKRGDKEVP